MSKSKSSKPKKGLKNNVTPETMETLRELRDDSFPHARTPVIEKMESEISELNKIIKDREADIQILKEHTCNHQKCRWAYWIMAFSFCVAFSGMFTDIYYWSRKFDAIPAPKETVRYIQQPYFVTKTDDRYQECHQDYLMQRVEIKWLKQKLKQYMPHQGE